MMLYLVSILFLPACNGLSIEAEWHKIVGPSANSIQQTSDGGYITVGGKNYDVCLKKMDSNGNEI